MEREHNRGERLFWELCNKGKDKEAALILSMDVFDPTAGNNLAIRRASEKGHVEVVKILYQQDPDHYNKKTPEVVKKWSLNV